uniref:Uncharacterized protein n=1 Tax=Fagus sylvatica TaxID=28930 RepID=A0A2N9F0C3_FAGSY
MEMPEWERRSKKHHRQKLPDTALATTFSYISTPIRATIFATVSAQTSLTPSYGSQSSQFDL